MLLAEDDNSVREVTREILKAFGYKVIETDSGERAVELFEKLDHAFDLLVTDVVMAGMSGRELA